MIANRVDNVLRAYGVLHSSVGNLAHWLENCGCHHVQPVMVFIDDENWFGARYYQTSIYQPGMDIVSRGLVKVGDTYTTEHIYCIGPVPKPYAVSVTQKLMDEYGSGICFPFENRDWFVAAYTLAVNITPTNQEYHPFGEHFILSPWTENNQAIDQGHLTPFKRITMAVSLMTGH